MKKICLILILIPLFAFSKESDQKSKPAFYVFSSIGERNIKAGNNKLKKDFNQSGFAVNFNHENSELYMQMAFRDFHESRLSSEGLRINYMYHLNFKFSLGLDYESIRGNMFYISDVLNPGEIKETTYDGMLFQVMAGYNFLSKKYYKVSLYGGIGRHSVVEMTGSYSVNGKTPAKDNIDKRSSWIYSINPRIEFRNDEDYRLKIDYIFRKSYNNTDSLSSQEQSESNLIISVGRQF